jgi:hypothetical protein
LGNGLLGQLIYGQTGRTEYDTRNHCTNTTRQSGTDLTHNHYIYLPSPISYPNLSPSLSHQPAATSSLPLSRVCLPPAVLLPFLLCSSVRLPSPLSPRRASLPLPSPRAPPRWLPSSCRAAPPIPLLSPRHEPLLPSPRRPSPRHGTPPPDVVPGPARSRRANVPSCRHGTMSRQSCRAWAGETGLNLRLWPCCAGPCRAGTASLAIYRSTHSNSALCLLAEFSATHKGTHGEFFLTELFFVGENFKVDY